MEAYPSSTGSDAVLTLAGPGMFAPDSMEGGRERWGECGMDVGRELSGQCTVSNTGLEWAGYNLCIKTDMFFLTLCYTPICG